MRKNADSIEVVNEYRDRERKKPRTGKKHTHKYMANNWILNELPNVLKLMGLILLSMLNPFKLK